MRTTSEGTAGSPRAKHLLDAAQDEYIFREGDLGTEMYIIREGEVEILHETGGEPEQVAVLSKGDFFGEMSLLEDLPRNASARALSAVRLVRVDGTTFDKMLRSELEIAVRIMRKLSRRLRLADEMLRELGGRAPRAGAAAAAPTEEPAVAPTHRLLHRNSETGIDFDVRAARLVGRLDPVTGIRPEIDLSGIDPERSSSRRHAKIFQRGGRLLLVEDIGTTNGTFHNEVRVETGVPVEIRPGDRLRFGLVDLELREI